MTDACEQLEPILRLAAAGDFDALAPAQVAALETHVNTCPRCTARLAEHVPEPDADLAPPVQMPSDHQWNQVWDEIQAAPDNVSGRGSPGIARLRRLWQPLVAAAACLFMIVMWRSALPAAESTWNLQLSDNVVVHEIETFGDVTSLVVYGDDNGAAVIWMLEDEGA
jgi:hypothetical protein